MAPELTDSDREPDETDGQHETSDPFHDGPSGPVEGALDVVDRSVGMYLLRRLIGRSTDRPSKRDAAPVVLSADEVAYRIGAAGAQHPRHAHSSGPVAGSATGGRLERATPGPARGRSGARTGEPRARLVRDSGVALLAMASVGLAAFIFWPGGGPTDEQPEGSDLIVNRAVVTPGPTGEVEAATAVATDQPTDPATTEPETAGPTPAPTSQVVSRATAAAGQPTPRPPARSTQRPSVTPTPRPTGPPTPTPASSPTATPTPTPDVTPEPTPMATPTPTPDVTPEPTPTPLDPTPDPTL